MAKPPDDWEPCAMFHSWNSMILALKYGGEMQIWYCLNCKLVLAD